MSVGDDYQAKVAAAPTGATFWFESGLHRLATPIDPKDGQTFLGAKGAVLDGSAVLTDFERAGSLYVASGQTQEGDRIATDEAAPGAVRGGFPETLFIDGQHLTPVASTDAVKAGTFYFDYAADKIYFADNPAGHLVETGKAAAAFESDAKNVTISNLTIEQFSSPVQHGAIQGGENWTVKNNEVRDNFGVGITVQAGSQVVGNYVHGNGEMGIGGEGANILVERNEIASNGEWAGIDPYWEGGGTKFALTTNLVVRDNYTHDNHGFGLWTDIDNIGTLYEGNLVVNNEGGGISHEISYDAEIRDNTLIGNGAKSQGWLWGGQIQIQNSQNVNVHDNLVDHSGGLNGIALIQQDRGSGAYGPYTTTSNTVHDNVLVSRSGEGASGGAADFNEAGMLNGGNVFANNEYHMADGNHWWWGDFPGGDDWAAYQAATNQDNGSVLTNAPIDTSQWLGGSGGATPTPAPAPAPTPAPETPSEPVAEGPDQPAPTPETAPTPTPEPSPTPEPVVVPAPGTATGGASLQGGGRIVDGDLMGSASGERLVGQGGALEIHGLGGDDRIVSSQASELLFGGAGRDTFVFRGESGNDSIEDFELGGSNADRIALDYAAFGSFDDVLAAARDVGSDTVIDLGESSLTLNDVSKGELQANDFLLI
ncbi:hypothetical protein ASG48_02775 [Aurantimonas sp. Leaf443]|nr:hypothetical protein ASG48_02775 [Aurantimonas sp. Leaf443]